MGLVHDVSTELGKLKQDRRALRTFGITMASCLAVLGVLMYFVGHHPPRALWTWLVGGAFLVLAFAAPRALREIHRVWMGLAFVLGWFVSRIILAILFYAIVTPIAVGMRLAGKDVLHEKIDRGATTYWIRRESAADDPKACEKLF